MYKVFVNDCLIILTENNNISTKLKKINFEEASILKITEELFNNKAEGICLLCSNLKSCWKQFKSYFKIQKAAGGKVFNPSNDVLFIYRFNKWDLPKGKINKGENKKDCAIREVEEECGIDCLHIEKKLETTYHIFKRNNKTILKITYWFLMKTDYKGQLIPQIEEDIEEVVFKNKEETKRALNNSYQNIKLLF
ncbi:MAG: NUDIX domain-containing protein [Lutibacter sp.]|nr:NUDIX domain-containing protein [Lutibacter sp.]